MIPTLKEQHATKKINSLRGHIKLIDVGLLKENHDANLIIEAMNKADLDKSTQIIDKLRKMTGKGLKTLDAAIEQAIGEINKYTGGGPLANAWTSMKSKVGIDNPLVKMMTFASALETGFEQVPIIIKNNVGEISKEDSEKNLTYVAGKKDPEVEKTVQKMLLKAFRPKGVFGAFRKVPYVNDMNEFAFELMNVPLKNLNALVQQSAQGAGSDEIAKDIKDVAAQSGDVESKGTQPGIEGGTPTEKGKQPEAGKTTTTGTPTAPAGEKPSEIAPDKLKRMKAAAAKLKQQLNVDDKQAQNILKTLEQMGMLK